MKKIVVLDTIGDMYEPYDRQYILGVVADCCHRNQSILRNASMTCVLGRGYKDGAWEIQLKWIPCISFEIDELTEAKWRFLQSLPDCWGAIKFGVLPDDWETTIYYPSEFR